MSAALADNAPPDRWAYWDGSPLPESASLRWGYTTGACAAAALTASFLERASGRDRTLPGEISLLFNDGVERILPVSPDMAGHPDWTVVRKNGGDDPDSTHGALVYARLTPLRGGDFRPAREDYIITTGPARVILRCVEGVGVATRDGLDCERGRWAINTGVRAMVAANLRRAGLAAGDWLAEVGVDGGEALARRTLNPTLGIMGGISLLGTTGLVRPYSNEAYVATIRVCARANARAGCHTFVLCTGGRTQKGARAWADAEGLSITGPLPDTAFTGIADFVGPAIRAARDHGMRRVIVCCMPGKLLKYARGLDNTHAHKNAQDMPALARLVAGLAPDEPALAVGVAASATVREALALLPDATRRALLDELARRALALLPERLAEDGTGDGACTKRPGFAILLTDATGRAIGWYADAVFDGQEPEPGAAVHDGEDAQ